MILLVGGLCSAQNLTERTFSAPPAKIQAALRNLPGGTSGSLPVLDGFVIPGARGLQKYERPFYQCSVHVTLTAAGASLVRVTAKITAWNSDPAHSGYDALRSNGRIESDLLDRLQQSLAGEAGTKVESPATSAPTSNSAATPGNKRIPAPELSAPMPRFPSTSVLKTSEPPINKSTASTSAPRNAALEQEAEGLEDLLKNQAHPTDLVAVKQDQTPVLQNPSSDAKTLFLASAEDEFEILDMNPEWVHVRISGLSRGWLLRSGVEMLDGSQPLASAATPASELSSSANSAPSASKLFSVTGEEEGSFPGDWAPLKGKNVKIVSIQQAPGTGVITSPQDKMRFAENLFKTETAEKSSAGLVLIFDAEDGGMVASTRAVLDLWKSGGLSEQMFWKQCYLDPPEILGNANQPQQIQPEDSR
jgi:hypothetical protein